MANFADYEAFDATGLAELIRTRQASSTEVVTAALDRIDERNPQWNAVVNRLDEKALRAARAFDAQDGPTSGLFAGVPFLVKDSGIQVKGERTSNGSRFWRDHLAVRDSTVTERYRAAGLIFLGFTNTAENGLASETAPAAYGPTLNPWNPERSAGGSSGGAAVAVASGMVPAAHATDGGGSIRVPSSNTGLFGLKPSRGRNPFGPDIGEGWNGLSVHHVVTRSVRDSAGFLDATHGSEPGDPYAAPHFPGSFVDALSRPPKPLKIALQTVGHDGLPIDPIVQAAARDAASLLSDLGHVIEEARPDIDFAAVKQATRIIVASNTANVLHMRGLQVGRPATEKDVEAITWLWGTEGKHYSAQELAWAITTIHQLSRVFGRFFGRYDMLLTPTLADPALPLRTIDQQSTDLDGYFEILYQHTIFTSIYNCAGLPAATIPLVWSGGLPIGVQIAGPLGADAEILALAAQLETARPWSNKLAHVSTKHSL
ncbi:putative amidase [Novosphingobium sp. Rr 2-17]|uniref:amidase n=1 Tax=Novosphingobium sp. Rr 2-17 TaxID=555793 RepID=UPI000269A21A|nr:amidase [Novosphingobium sp. Rr 2-17]EIZ77938.1 putative amidase [Novosphingobium sp. Rr 2-17]